MENERANLTITTNLKICNGTLKLLKLIKRNKFEKSTDLNNIALSQIFHLNPKLIKINRKI
jgi:hypothetical protein